MAVPSVLALALAGVVGFAALAGVVNFAALAGVVAALAGVGVALAGVVVAGNGRGWVEGRALGRGGALSGAAPARARPRPVLGLAGFGPTRRRDRSELDRLHLVGGLDLDDARQREA